MGCWNPRMYANVADNIRGEKEEVDNNNMWVGNIYYWRKIRKRKTKYGSHMKKIMLGICKGSYIDNRRKLVWEEKTEVNQIVDWKKKRFKIAKNLGRYVWDYWWLVTGEFFFLVSLRKVSEKKPLPILLLQWCVYVCMCATSKNRFHP